MQSCNRAISGETMASERATIDSLRRSTGNLSSGLMPSRTVGSGDISIRNSDSSPQPTGAAGRLVRALLLVATTPGLMVIAFDDSGVVGRTRVQGLLLLPVNALSLRAILRRPLSAR